MKFESTDLIQIEGCLNFFWKTVHIPKWKFWDVTTTPLERNLTPTFREIRNEEVGPRR
jgi:hypothetical protein